MRTTKLQRVAVACGAVWLGFAADEVSAAIPASERAALIALYNSTNGAAWRHRINWLGASGTECTWEGVVCDGPGNHVVFLSLGQNQLTGSIPPQIGSLSQLAWLSLDDNQLGGSIPPEIGNLSQLTGLELDNNQLTGSIPPEIGNLTSLETLVLANNQLTGPVPPEIGNLRKLLYLHLYSNQLNGSIPREIGNLTTLSSLVLSRNQLTGPIPPEIGNLTNYLWVFDLAHNQLSGSIPPEIGNLRLNTLHLDNNQLTGAIPREIANLGTPNELHLDHNQLTGTIPPELFSLVMNLEDDGILTLDHNQLSGSIPPEIGNLTTVFYLALDHNQLSGSIPSEIGNLTSVYRLHLEFSDNQLSGSIPPEIGNLTNLGSLTLDNNQLSGSIPPEIGNLTNLGSLTLDNNQLSGSIPPEIGNLTNLGYLRLDNNQLSGSIPPDIGNLTTLSGLDLSNNQLTGSIPSGIGNLTTLYSLDLSGNQLTGSIPRQIGNLVMGHPWEHGGLYLDHNQLSGPIPSTIGNVKYLGALTLNNNQLSGPIPPEIGNLRYLASLRVQGNQLRGPIPATLANMTGLANGGSDLTYNALYTSDAALRAFLNLKQMNGDWESTQTIAPTGLAAGVPGPDTVPLSWSSILYTGDTGGYRIWYGTLPGGLYNLSGTTADKAVSASAVSGLSPGTTYYFALDTVTEPHANNQNTVVSERSGEVSATTTAGGVGWYGLTVVRYGPGTVSSSPGGIACGGACSATFAPGIPVTLTAAPDAGSTFLGWGGTCSGTALTCDLAMDAAQTVTAAFSTPAVSFYTVKPCRVYDSRDAGLGGPSPLAAGTDTAVVIGGYCAIPPTAKAVSLNVTVVSPGAGGHLRLYPWGMPRPATSSINYAASQTRANNAVVSLGGDESLTVYVNQPSGTTHVVIDVNGYFQ